MINLPPPHLFFAVVILTCSCSGQNRIAAAEAKSLNLANAGIVRVQSGTLAEKAANILTDEIAKRTGIEVPRLKNGPESGTPTILIQTLTQFNHSRLPSDVELPHVADSYAIWIEDSLPAPTVILLGCDDRATLFAAGRLLRLLSMTKGRLELSAETRFSSAPDVAIRGHQLGYRESSNSYDDMGCVDRQPHVLPALQEKTWESDPGFVSSPQSEFGDRVDTATLALNDGKLSWLNQAETLFGTPLRMRYTDLDPQAKYRLRVTYAGRFRATMRLLADQTYEVHGPLPQPSPIWPIEFEIPPEATADGILDLQWELLAQRGCQVAEVWLIKQ